MVQAIGFLKGALLMPVLLWLVLVAPLAFPAASVPTVQTHDNLRPAGRLDGNVLTLRLNAETGRWWPEGPEGIHLDVPVFGEEAAPPSVPGPLIRVPEGTEVIATLRNGLASELRVHGLCSRPGPCEPIAIASGAVREIRFALHAPGTYGYWGTMTGAPLARRRPEESQLGGAIVVDRRGAAAADRIFLISTFAEPPAPPVHTEPRPVFAINGRSWPYTEILDHRTGDELRWRVVNLSSGSHAMHLHGFHFTVEATGDGLVDRAYAQNEQRLATTERLAPGGTLRMRWTPGRPGNWLFHCHMVAHMAAPMTEQTGTEGHHPDDEKAAGMAGLVLGIRVSGQDLAREAAAREPRRFSLIITEEPRRYGDRPGFRFDVEGVETSRLDPGPVPGPVIVLTRGEPVEITVLNRLDEPTAVHWHGIEVDSYFDGVPGWGGRSGRIAPPVAPGGSFVARLTPPRAGTFIYHTHWHDEAQLSAGLYGPLIVVEPGERYDPETDHVLVIGLNGTLAPDQREPFALNGKAVPSTIRLRAGARHRLRLINITANNVALNAFLVSPDEPMVWKALAKDGANLPPSQAVERPARQPVAVGETYDFEVHPTRTQNLWFEVRRGNGEWVLQAPVEVR